MSKSILLYKPNKINQEAANFLFNHGYEGYEVFDCPDWEELITAAYTHPDTGRIKPLARFKSRKADYFMESGYKHSIVFQKLIHTGTGNLKCLIVEVPKENIEAPDFRGRVLDPILKHAQFKSLVLSYNVQRGQTENSAHIHLLAFIPDSHEIKKRIRVGARFYTVRDDVEAFTGAYQGQSIAIGTRKLVQYHRSPRDQRYRNWGNSRAAALAEEWISHLERKESGVSYKPNTLAGVRNMSALIEEITPQEKERELAGFAAYHKAVLSPKAQKAIRAVKKATKERKQAESKTVPYNPVSLSVLPPKNTPFTPSHTAEITPDATHSLVIQFVVNLLILDMTQQHYLAA